MKKICTPALLYLILGILSLFILILSKVGIMSIFIKVLFIVVWTFFLNFLCKSGYETISWIFVLLPFIILIIFILFFYNLMKKLFENGDFMDEIKRGFMYEMKNDTDVTFPYYN
jgi:hypothetical protein